MITLKFSDRETTQSNPKSARAWLRKNGMNVRQCTKKGDIWQFPFALGNKVPYLTVTKPERCEPKMMPCVNVGSLLPSSERRPTTVTMQNLPRPIHHTPVRGADLLPNDLIVNFAESYDLTVNRLGIHTIEHVPNQISGYVHRYLGFRSVESGGISSYRIDPERVYDVIRSEVT